MTSNDTNEPISKDKQIRMAINRAKEQGLDINGRDLIDCWKSSSNIIAFVCFLYSICFDEKLTRQIRIGIIE